MKIKFKKGKFKNIKFMIDKGIFHKLEIIQIMADIAIMKTLVTNNNLK